MSDGLMGSKICSLVHKYRISVQLTRLIDGDEDKLDEEAEEAHRKESNGCKASYFRKLLAIWLFTALQQPAGQS
jgi:hypothetical protein